MSIGWSLSGAQSGEEVGRRKQEQAGQSEGQAWDERHRRLFQR